MNFNKILFANISFLGFILYSPNIFSQLTENSKVSLITVGPGTDLYSAFGHSALYISDPNLSIDNVYNYGTYSFTDGFYWRFTKGELDYMLAVEPFPQDYYIWTIIENRSVTRQVFNLTLKQKNALFEFLENNALPENCIYRYDYFYDNCSNRIDKALIKVLGDSLEFFPEKVLRKQNKRGSTIRQLLHSYLLKQHWGELGIGTCLGIEMDKKITPAQFKFLPDYLMWNYDEAKIKSNGVYEPLLKEKDVLFESLEQSTKNSAHYFFLNPVLIFSLVLASACIFSIPIIHNTTFAKLFDFMLFFVCGAIGLLIVFLWFFTTHYSQINLNLLWANPGSLFLAFLPFYRKYNHKFSTLYVVYGVSLTLILFCWFFLPQKLNDAYLIICFALILRCFTNFLLLRKINVSQKVCK